MIERSKVVRPIPPKRSGVLGAPATSQSVMAALGSGAREKRAVRLDVYEVV